MSRQFKIRDQEAVHFVTFTTIQWLDVFVRAEYRDIFLDSIRYCQKNKGLEVYAYCIMSSHIHMILARHGKQNLEGVIRDVKNTRRVRSLKPLTTIPRKVEETY
jgi:putative transposase